MSNQMLRRVSWIWALAVFSFLAGCGYTQEAQIPGGIKTIAVRPFKNEIPPKEQFAYRPGLEVELTNALIDRFIFDGNLKVADETKADAVFEGAIISFEQEGLRFDRLESVEEYRLFLVVKFKLIDQRTKEILMEEPNFSGRAEFFVNRNPAGNRRLAANSATFDLARSLVDRIVEEW
ncbi:MAG: LptE family protein [Candidatus Omnitrophica bacterium]|nr:LptE family protein [Candidatus Omnitrophota bacterium]